MFIRGSYAAQDAAMQRMRTLIKDPTLAASLEELVGAKYITAFKKIAKTYSTMVKAMGRVVPTTVDQRSVLGLMQVSIVQHASIVLGELRDADPKSVARTRALLAPIDNFRARQSTNGAAASKPEATPTPADLNLDELEPAELS